MKLLTSLLYGALFAAEVTGKKLTASQVEGDIKKSKLKQTLSDLNKIGVANGGNRAFGLPGYKASLDYILSIVEGKYGKYLDTYVQPFNHTFEQTRDIWVRGPDGEDEYVITLIYNSATPTPDGVTAELIPVPVDLERGSGCFEDQWDGIDATGKIALVMRGSCAISDKLKLAKAHGALAVILINQTPGDNIGSATLGAENLGLLVPVGVIRYAVGTGWLERLAAGETLEATLLVDSINEIRESWNIISETKEGDPNNVVMLGAHLDSVQAGPGINDDGSGTAAILEVAKSFSKYKGYTNKVRFAWWGAEESGLIGSLYYGSQLTSGEADKIRFYFNYDMIGSPYPTYSVYANNDGDKVGGDIILKWLQKKGKDAQYGEFGSSSDYVAFLELGIPSSGIFTGADSETDPCYHLACDTTDNINWSALTLNAKTAGRAAAQFALSLEGVPPRAQTSTNPKSKRSLALSFEKWEAKVKVVGKQHSCAASGKVVV
ncbi:hypothetical protein BGZ61DRAFT_337715 [Ilyonectria robusta]|uniref:uncharacterized protein n=1 Tax=Ilyonectria robusta TaxID=1079257 RepID=UPI001E8CF086|nr:uncharacterized protein BGZ61DRAFT_337715 [Ilyonectria robusta]KAH8738238.1 hypothetical protein BGZ61DRAFT_337715 [Ilyonectria robusta]